MTSRVSVAYSYVRMSTTAQLKGRSKKRQLEASAAYAAEHGLTLQTEFELEDIGVSAFKGANIKHGALGRFLEAVKAGSIERGSYLLVESLDRLSRQEVRKSLALFLQIIDAGINIVTLADNHVYTAEKADEVELITSLVMLSRAHDESRIKSQRIRDSWVNRRANVQARKVTAVCPAWLRLSSDRNSFEVIEDRAEIVRSIFEESARGLGNYSITHRLNETTKPFGKSHGWHNSYIAKILENRAVLGEFQPHEVRNGKREAIGKPIPNYFPAVIEEELFFRAKTGRTQRRINGSGRKGARISNLFSGIAKCAYCGSPMRFENKGSGPKGGAFLACDSAKRGLGCDPKRWRYDEFEASFLSFVSELDLESIARSHDQTNRRPSLDHAIAALEGIIVSIETERERAYELFAKMGSDSDFVANKLIDCEQRLSDVRRSLEDKQTERASLATAISGFYEGKEEIKVLLGRLQDPNGDDELYRLRSQIAARLKGLVESVVVATAGSAPYVPRMIEFLASKPNPPLDEIEQLRSTLELEGTHERHFSVIFKNGNVRGVTPSANDPLVYEEQILGTLDDLKLIDAAGKSMPFPHDPTLTKLMNG